VLLLCSVCRGTWLYVVHVKMSCYLWKKGDMAILRVRKDVVLLREKADMCIMRVRKNITLLREKRGNVHNESM
jgi:hypothetical protein